MLLLVNSHGHKVSLIQKNVGRHQNGIGKQARIDVFRVLLGFVLKLRHTAQLAELGIAGQYPAKLRMSGIMSLNKHYGLIGIYSNGKQKRIALLNLSAKLRGILSYGDGVKIHYAVSAVVLLL